MVRRRSFRRRFRRRTRRYRPRRRRRVARRPRRRSRVPRTNLFVPKPMVKTEVHTQTYAGFQGCSNYQMLTPLYDNGQIYNLTNLDATQALYQQGSTQYGIDATGLRLKGKVYHELQNTTNAVINYRIYWVVAKENVPMDVLTTGVSVAGGAETGSNSTLYDMFVRSAQNVTQIAPTLPSTSNVDIVYEFPQHRPWHSEEFMAKFKIYKKMSFDVDPGGRFRISQTCPWRYFDTLKYYRDLTGGNNIGIAWYKGISRFVLVQCIGQAVGNKDVDGSYLDNTNASYIRMSYATPSWTCATVMYKTFSPVHGTNKPVIFDLTGSGLFTGETEIDEIVPTTVNVNTGDGGETATEPAPAA
jgi:hypothetical protein